MHTLRQVIRKIILEGEIYNHEVSNLAADDDFKRMVGHYAKKLFQQRADHKFLQNELTYITCRMPQTIDQWISRANPKNEISCLVNSYKVDHANNHLDINYGLGAFFNNRVGLIVKGWPTWVSNKNAATGHTGSILQQMNKEFADQSGVNKAPSKMYGRFASHELDHIIMDEDDLDYKGIVADGYGNNEALLDNWTVVGVCNIIGWTDSEDKLTDEYQKNIQKVYNAVKKKWPKAKLIDCIID